MKFDTAQATTAAWAEPDACRLYCHLMDLACEVKMAEAIFADSIVLNAFG